MPIEEREAIRKKLASGVSRKKVAEDHGISVSSVGNISDRLTEPKHIDPRWKKYVNLVGKPSPRNADRDAYLDWELANVTKSQVATIRSVWADKSVRVGEMAYYLELDPCTIWAVGGNLFIEGI